MPVPSDDKLIELLLDTRDEHVRRLHSISGHVALIALTVAVTLFAGAVIGIDALVDVDLAGEPGLLLGIGGCAFAASFLLLSLALVHHTRDRSAAASHIEDAVARLMSGGEREGVLADLGSSIARLLHPRQRARLAPYLATELNSRRLGLTLYQKTFLGFALLLLASLAIGLGIIEGYAPALGEDADSDVAAGLHVGETMHTDYGVPPCA